MEQFVRFCDLCK